MREAESEEMLLVTEIVSAVSSAEATELLYERMTQLNELSPQNPAVLLGAAFLLGASEQELDELRYLELAHEAFDTTGDRPLDRKARMLRGMVLPMVRARLASARWQAGDADGCLELVRRMGELDAHTPSKLSPHWISELAELQIESGRWDEFKSLLEDHRGQGKVDPSGEMYGLLAKFLAHGDTRETRSAAKNMILRHEERVAAVLNMNPTKGSELSSADLGVDSLDDVHDGDFLSDLAERSNGLGSFGGIGVAGSDQPAESEFDAGLWTSWRRVPDALSWLRDQAVEVMQPEPGEIHGPTPAVLNELSKLPQTADDWQVDVQQPAAWFSNGPQVTRPYATVVYSVTGNCVVAQQLTSDRAESDRVFDVLAAGCRGLFGREPQRPRSIQFRDAGLQSELKEPLTKLGIESVVNEKLDELAAFQQPMADVWSGDAVWPAVSETADVNDAALKSFYSAAADAFESCVVPGNWVFGRTFRVLWCDPLAQPDIEMMDIPGGCMLREGFVQLVCHRGMAPTLEMLIAAVHFEMEDDAEAVLADRLKAVAQSPNGFMLGAAGDGEHDAGCGEDCTDHEHDHDHDGEGTDITMQFEIVRENENGEFDDDDADDDQDDEDGEDSDNGSTNIGLLRVVYSEKFAIRQQDVAAMQRLAAPVRCETAYPILLADTVADEPRRVTAQDVRDATVLLRGLVQAAVKFAPLEQRDESAGRGILIETFTLPDPAVEQSAVDAKQSVPIPGDSLTGPLDITVSVVQSPRMYELA